VIVRLSSVGYSGDTIATEGMVEDMANNTRQISTMLTVREVSRLLHVHSNTLRRWSDQGIIKAYRIGPRGDRRFRPEDIAVLLLEESKGFPLAARESAPPNGPQDSLERYVMSR
jgi:excisionase family DNA binding protein